MLTDQSEIERRTRILYEVLKETGRRRFEPNKEDCDEVYPDIFIGDRQAALNKQYLKDIGITHVVNTAMGNEWAMVNTNAEFYKDVFIEFLGIHVVDLPHAKISYYFNKVADFMEAALASNGKVYVHCLMGMSRSASCVIAFLMLKRGMTAKEAIIQVRSHRSVCPNEGFMAQIATLDLKLEERRSLDESDDSKPSRRSSGLIRCWR